MVRDYKQFTTWVDGLTDKESSDLKDKVIAGSLDYNLILEQAERLEVYFGSVLRSLKWIAEHRPRHLEMLMNTEQPGSVLFEAVTLVYNANLDCVLLDVDTENNRIRDAGIAGLKRAKANPKMKPRPVTAKMQPRPITAKRRVFLKE